MRCTISYVCCIWLGRSHSSLLCVPPHVEDSAPLFYFSSMWNLFHASALLFLIISIFSLHRSFLCPSFQFSPLLWPGLTQDFSFWVHTARHCGKSAGVNGGTGRGIDGGARERRVGGALRKHSICCFPKAKIFPWGWGNRRRGLVKEEARQPMSPS